MGKTIDETRQNDLARQIQGKIVEVNALLREARDADLRVDIRVEPITFEEIGKDGPGTLYQITGNILRRVASIGKGVIE